MATNKYPWIEVKDLSEDVFTSADLIISYGGAMLMATVSMARELAHKILDVTDPVSDEFKPISVYGIGVNFPDHLAIDPGQGDSQLIIIHLSEARELSGKLRRLLEDR